MTNLILRACIFLAMSSGAAASEDERWFRLMDKIAASQGLEAVRGESFPVINPYWNDGSPYAFNFIDNVEASVIFLARKRKPHKDPHSAAKTVMDLINDYDYFWILAVREKGHEAFVVKSTVLTGLKGLTLYYGDLGALDINAKEFIHVNSGRKMAGSALDRRRLMSPAILVSAASSVQTLFYYDGSLIEHNWADR